MENEDTTTTLGTKTLVLSQLAAECLHLVKVEAGKETPAEPEISPEPIASISFAGGDDLPFEHKNRSVSGYDVFLGKMNEGMDIIISNLRDKAIDYVLSELKKDAGSLHIDNVLNVVEEKKTTIKKYISGLMDDFISKENIYKLCESSIKEDIDNVAVLNVASRLFAEQVSSDIITLIYKSKDHEE